MQEENVPGLAIAVVDDQNILWEEGFGTTDWDRQMPVTPSTLFSIQSMSKSFTATAAMFAAQDGLVDLDAPITTYLPDFHVNSIFEEHPEQKITLRMLLSHTAGFAHEAPYRRQLRSPGILFEKHIASISDTWLMFPVGTRYSYSNLGIDLAGYILQVRSGMPFTQYVQEKVLDPLGMKNSTLDVNQVRATPHRAIGHTGCRSARRSISCSSPLAECGRPPRIWPVTCSSTSIKALWTEPACCRKTWQRPCIRLQTLPAHLYALGIGVNTRNGARHFEHGGGGFGFNSRHDLVSGPEAGGGRADRRGTIGSVLHTQRAGAGQHY